VTTSELDRVTEQRPIPAATQATAVEQARAIAEVAAAVRVAQDFPRDVPRAVIRMQEACAQRALADRAFYSLPRAGGRVEGSTVHLARQLAACWGNLDYGIRELRRDDDAGESEMQAWAWDQESNVRSSRSFVVPHARMKGSGAQKKREALTDLGDIANNNNSVAARAVRETIFTILPVWYVTDAEERCRAALNGAGGDAPMAQQIAEMVSTFETRAGVTKGQLEAYLALPTSEWTPQTLGALRILGGEIARGEKRVEDEFPRADTDVTSRRVSADDLTTTQEGNDA
jgi:hypothetical protein